MAQNKKATRKTLLKFILAHPIQNAKTFLALKKAKDVELVALWYYSNKELKKRGVK